MLTRLCLLWLSLLVPWVLSGVIGGPIGLLPHAVFHPVYIAFLVVSVLAAWALRRASGRRSVRALAVVVAAMSAAAIIGQAGEEVVVVAHGGLDAPDSLMQDPVHFAWAIAGEGGLFFGLFAMTVLSAVAGIILLRAGDRRGWAVLACGIASMVDFLLLFGSWTALPAGLVTLLAVLVLGFVAGSTRTQPSVLDAVEEGLHGHPGSAIVAP